MSTGLSGTHQTGITDKGFLLICLVIYIMSDSDIHREKRERNAKRYTKLRGINPKHSPGQIFKVTTLSRILWSYTLFYQTKLQQASIIYYFLTFSNTSGKLSSAILATL